RLPGETVDVATPTLLEREEGVQERGRSGIVTGRVVVVTLCSRSLKWREVFVTAKRHPVTKQGDCKPRRRSPDEPTAFHRTRPGRAEGADRGASPQGGLPCGEGGLPPGGEGPPYRGAADRPGALRDLSGGGGRRHRAGGAPSRGEGGRRLDPGRQGGCPEQAGRARGGRQGPDRAFRRRRHHPGDPGALRSPAREEDRRPRRGRQAPPPGPSPADPPAPRGPGVPRGAVQPDAGRGRVKKRSFRRRWGFKPG